MPPIGILPLIVFIVGAVKITKRIIDDRKEKKQLKRNDVTNNADSEEVIKTPIDFSSKCSNCGATVNTKAGDRVMAFCPFCGAPIMDTKEMISKAIEHKQTVEIETLRHEQEIKRLEAEAKLETRKERRIAVERGARAAASTTTGCLGSCLGFIGQGILSIVMSVVLLAVCAGLFIKFLPEILDFFFDLFGKIFNAIVK